MAELKGRFLLVSSTGGVDSTVNRTEEEVCIRWVDKWVTSIPGDLILEVAEAA